MTPKDMNSTVRAHLRKGELAVEHLEKLGWTFEQNVSTGPFVWKAPEEDALVKAVVDLIESRLVKPADPKVDLKAGDHFVVSSLPEQYTALRVAIASNPVRVFKAREVEFSDRWQCWIARFGFNGDNSGFWLPVTHLTKVKTYDNL